VSYKGPGEACIDCGAIAPPPTMHPAMRYERRGTYPNEYAVDIGPVCADCCAKPVREVAAPADTQHAHPVGP
jgi:hypothetical protein